MPRADHPMFKDMNMRAIFFFLWLGPLVFGRLGDNRSELVNRLGAIRLESQHTVIAQGKISPLGPALFFEKDGWQVQCDLIDERCVRITYSKTGEWTSGQLATLLKNNEQGAAWREDPDSNKMIRKWTRADKGTATWKFTGNLQLTSPAYLRHVQQREDGLRKKSQGQPNL